MPSERRQSAIVKWLKGTPSDVTEQARDRREAGVWAIM
jgi:hypothetical protein